MAKALRGSCLCGGIRYTITQALDDILFCHCSICRKAQGVAFRARASVKRANMHFLSGENLLTGYRSSSGEQRTFCRVCGSPIITRFDAYPEVYGFALGTLDDVPSGRPVRHVYVDSRAPWDVISDKLPREPAGGFARTPRRRL